MASGSVFTSLGRKILLHRGFDPSPVYTAPTAFKVGIGTATPTEADVDLGNAISIAGNPTKAFNAGYPAYDDTNLQVTIRGQLATTECNGNSITEFGLFNADGTPQCFSHIVFPAQAKTAAMILIFVEKDYVTN